MTHEFFGLEGKSTKALKSCIEEDLFFSVASKLNKITEKFSDPGSNNVWFSPFIENNYLLKMKNKHQSSRKKMGQINKWT